MTFSVDKCRLIHAQRQNKALNWRGSAFSSICFFLILSIYIASWWSGHCRIFLQPRTQSAILKVAARKKLKFITIESALHCVKALKSMDSNPSILNFKNGYFIKQVTM